MKTRGGLLRGRGRLVDVVSFADFDRYCEENGIGPDEHGETFARWLGEQTGRPVRFEKVEPGDERILEEWEQRDLDGVPSFLALRGERKEPERA